VSLGFAAKEATSGREYPARYRVTKQTLIELLGCWENIFVRISISCSHKRRQVVQLLPANDGSLLRRSSRVILRERLVAFAVRRNKYDVNDCVPVSDGGFKFSQASNFEAREEREEKKKTVIARCPAHE